MDFRLRRMQGEGRKNIWETLPWMLPSTQKKTLLTILMSQSEINVVIDVNFIISTRTPL